MNTNPYLMHNTIWTKDNYNFVIKELLENNVSYPDILRNALENGASKEIILQIVNTIPIDGLEDQMIEMISDYIQKEGFNSLLLTNTPQAFNKYNISNLIDSNIEISSLESPEDIASGAMISLKSSTAVLERFSLVMKENILGIDAFHIVEAALSSKNGMKFVLSALMPHLIEENPKAIEVIQNISAHPKGNPAKLLIDELKKRNGIKIIV